MTEQKSINSDAYWDSRFEENWETFAGPAQSRFFSRLAIDHLPRWLINELKKKELTLADWGCAQGDGTDVWSAYLDAEQLSGIDFSEVAIKQAQQRYPAIKFLCEDWLDASSSSDQQTFDVVFSSNTLEHFHQPYPVLNAIALRADKAVVLALPYKELDRIDEHFYTFLADNIPLTLGNGFRLCWAKAVDCRKVADTLWHGFQIVLVYAAPAWLDTLSLVLADTYIAPDDSVAEVRRLTESLAALQSFDAELNQALRNVIKQREQYWEERCEYARELGLVQDQYAQSDFQISQLAKQCRAYELQLNNILSSRSWKVTGPLRIVARLLRGLIKKDKAALKSVLRSVYERSPEATKPLLRSAYQKVRSYTGGPSDTYVTSEVDAHPLTHLADPTPHFGAVRQKPDYYFFGVIDWHLRHQRPQHLALELASKGHRVFYIGSTIVDNSRPGFSAEAIDPLLPVFNIELHAAGAPIIYFGPPSNDELTQLRCSIGQLLEKADTQRVVAIVQHPFWTDIAAALPNSRVIYDCMDHHDGFDNTAKEIIDLERRLFKEADLTITTSSWLDTAVAPYTEHRAIVRNGGEFSHFSVRPESTFTDSEGRKIIGYYGAIAEWFDVELVEAIAERFDDCCILLIGADTARAGERLSGYKNVVFTGEVPYSQLPFYLHAFDVCLLPFKIIPLTLATNPVKVYEYLCAGKPVVAVDLPEMSQFDGLVKIGIDTPSFLEAIAEAMRDPGTSEIVSQRQRFASEQTWSNRVDSLLNSVETHLKPPKVSVVVVTFNNINLTRDCLRSIDHYSQYDNLEVIVVDNASKDDTPSYLSTWASQGGNRQIILNTDNRGFAAANNQGLKVASGEYLVLLNNDTFVTPGWVSTLVKHLQRDSTIGIIGPVTNNIGNEAKIDISYTNMDEMIAASRKYTLANIGKVFPLTTAAFFCVMFSREIYEKVGDLDESFGRGFFEDDDFCRRVEAIGKRIVCAEDVFIHHHLSASFNKLDNIERLVLFEMNKVKYEKKWGKWAPHASRAK